MFPLHSEKWDTDDGVKTVLNAPQAHKQGYKNFHFVGGQDRRQGMEDLLRRYNDDLYKFDNIYSHSAVTVTRTRTTLSTSVCSGHKYAMVMTSMVSRVDWTE